MVILNFADRGCDVNPSRVAFPIQGDSVYRDQRICLAEDVRAKRLSASGRDVRACDIKTWYWFQPNHRIVK